MDFNIRQKVYPVFGIGLGMDIMLYISNEKHDIASDCVLDNLIASLILSDKGQKRKWFLNAQLKTFVFPQTHTKLRFTTRRQITSKNL